MKKNILIFYISRYSGHYQAAKAIQAGALELFDDARVRTVNALLYTNPILGSIITKAYIRLIKKRPEIWGNIYDDPEILRKTQGVRDRLNKFNMPKMKRLIESFSPDIIYCTQAFPCGMVAEYKKLTGENIPLVGVLTDYAPHSYWLNDEVDLYAVPSESTASALREKGVPASRIRVSGIPIDPKFSIRADRGAARAELGFTPDDPVLLVMGGNQGIGSLEEAVKALLRDNDHRYRIIVVTGANRKLYARLMKLEKKEGRERIRTLSFFDRMDLLMDASDIIITKAGGMTTTEALAKKLPIVILDPIPGHERMNADYLVKQGAAVEVKDITGLHTAVNRILDLKKNYDGMRTAAGKISRPESSMDICRMALEV
ncbi:MAG: glycosyltransferase [Candidatus Omnitrophica bacterium]|nr:glycosyltransferase [Candidatus Omnitrophota bacterium]